VVFVDRLISHTRVSDIAMCAEKKSHTYPNATIIFGLKITLSLNPSVIVLHCGHIKKKASTLKFIGIDPYLISKLKSVWIAVRWLRGFAQTEKDILVGRRAVSCFV